MELTSKEIRVGVYCGFAEVLSVVAGYFLATYLGF